MRTKDELIKIADSFFADEADILVSLFKTKLLQKNETQKIIHRERNQLICPYCKSTNIYKNGKTKIGNQKYICRTCNKSFSDSNDSIVFSSKKSYLQWIKFIHCEILGLTLKRTSLEVGISQTTAFAWRHKLYFAIGKIKQDIVLNGIIQIDGYFISINLKGTKKNNMPRYSKKRSSSAYRGVSHHKVCIMCGIDDNDNLFLEIVGLGGEANNMMDSLSYKIKEGSKLVCDGKFAFLTFCKNHNCSIELVKSKTYKNENGYDMNSINGIHSELRKYLAKRRGVSIRHLQEYLDMFLFLKLLEYSTEPNLQDVTTFNKAIPTRAKLLVKQIFELAIPIDFKKAYGDYHYGIFSNR